MKKIIIVLFFIIYFGPINVLSFNVLFDSNIVKEGGIVKIKIDDKYLWQAGEVIFLDKKYPVFFNGFNNMEKVYKYFALLPVPLGKSGKKLIRIRLMRKNKKYEKKEYIRIKKIKVKKRQINTGKINKKFLSDLSKENKIIRKVQNNITRVKYKFPFIVPVTGRITGEFGKMRIYDNGKATWRHKGIDIAAKRGTPVKACEKGKIKLATFTKGHGNVIIIDHGGGLYSLYYHLDKIYVQNNDIVNKGDIIGTVGNTGLSTGPHLHWQINLFKIPINPNEVLTSF